MEKDIKHHVPETPFSSPKTLAKSRGQGKWAEQDFPISDM
jgi:hypothetical protein